MMSIMWLAVLTGCKKVDPAPQDLDSLMHGFWDAYDAGSDADLSTQVDELHDLANGDSLEDPIEGTIDPLDAGELDALGLGDKNAGAAMGLVIVDTFACSLPQLETILSYLKQDEIYDKAYDDYTRTYTDDSAAYFDRAIPTLTWHTHFASSVLGTSYTADPYGALRYVEETSFGPALFARTYVKDPYVFENDNKSVAQDYQVEVFYDRGNDTIVHAYAMWKQADFGSGLTSDDEGVQRLMINGLEDWDGDTEKLCEEGRP